MKKWKDVTQALTNSAQKILGDAEVVPFGSIVEGKGTATSDLDILIIAKDLPKNALDRAQITGIDRRRIWSATVSPNPNTPRNNGRSGD